MGMFDRMYFDVPLPPHDVVYGTEFQTKDLDCLMDEYQVRVDGRVYKRVVQYEYVPESERPPEPPDSSTFSEKMAWLHTSQRLVSDTWSFDPDFHGYINFYGNVPVKPGSSELVWRDYRAKFTDGRLVSVIAHDDLRR